MFRTPLHENQSFVKLAGLCRGIRFVGISLANRIYAH